MSENGFCPVAATADIVGRKWALIAIHNLLESPLGFNELKRSINGVSSKTLSNSLTYLTKEGIVSRKVHQNSPIRVEYTLTIRVEYTLTQKGREMKGLIGEMKRWGQLWLENK
jgi:DNA-binding HxlR family transcriptional regulator